MSVEPKNAITTSVEIANLDRIKKVSQGYSVDPNLSQTIEF